VSHTAKVPLPRLVRIGAADHPQAGGERHHNRMSFTFTTAFPTYQFQYVDTLIGDASGQQIPLDGQGILKITFRQAQAHTDAGASSVVSRPAAHLGLDRMVAYAAAGDYEGVVTYGIGVRWPVTQVNPQIAVRAYEVTKVTSTGQRLYVVAIDINATS
jgi:hypothetical protein